MKNVKVIFTDTDYELVKKACQQYDKLVKDYQFKSAVSELLSLITIVSGFFVMFILFAVTDDTFTGSIIVFSAVALSIILVALSAVYNQKNKRINPYLTNCFNVKCNMEEIEKEGSEIQFGMDMLCNELFYDIYNPDYEYRRHMSSVANEIPDTDNIVLRLEEIVDKHGFVSYVWQAESA
jgi:hypothetical protein